MRCPRLSGSLGKVCNNPIRGNLAHPRKFGFAWIAAIVQLLAFLCANSVLAQTAETISGSCNPLVFKKFSMQLPCNRSWSLIPSVGQPVAYGSFVTPMHTIVATIHWADVDPETWTERAKPDLEDTQALTKWLAEMAVNQASTIEKLVQGIENEISTGRFTRKSFERLGAKGRNLCGAYNASATDTDPKGRVFDIRVMGRICIGPKADIIVHLGYSERHLPSEESVNTFEDEGNKFGESLRFE